MALLSLNSYLSLTFSAFIMISTFTKGYRIGHGSCLFRAVLDIRGPEEGISFGGPASQCLHSELFNYNTHSEKKITYLDKVTKFQD